MEEQFVRKIFFFFETFWLIHLAGLRVLKHFSPKKNFFSFIFISLHFLFHFPFHILSFSSCLFFSLSSSLSSSSCLFFSLSSSLFSLLFSSLVFLLLSSLFSSLVSSLLFPLLLSSCLVWSSLVFSGLLSLSLSLSLSLFLCLSLFSFCLSLTLFVSV